MMIVFLWSPSDSSIIIIIIIILIIIMIGFIVWLAEINNSLVKRRPMH